MKDKKMDQTIA